jgi:hypothetical protein
MGDGPPGSPCRRRSQTAAVSCRSRAGVGSDCGKGPLSAGQVSDGKTNVCEPLLTHRNRQGWHRNRRMCRTSGTKARRRGVPSAGERPACGPGGARCKGGVSSSQALARNRRTCRLDTDGQGRCGLAARGRTPSGGNREGQSTARHRGGPARSSEEGPVMGLERRGRAGQVTLRSTRWGRS